VDIKEAAMVEIDELAGRVEDLRMRLAATKKGPAWQKRSAVVMKLCDDLLAATREQEREIDQFWQDQAGPSI
jgi:hypothetical protein